MTTGFTRADPLASLLIAALILPRSFALLRDAVDVLLETTPAHLDLDDVRDHLRRGARAWSTCTTCTRGRSPAACPCCPRT